MLFDDCTVEFCFAESSNKAALKSVRQILLQSYSGKKAVDFGKPVWDNAVANTTLIKMLRNTTYIGILRRGEIQSEPHPALQIIDSDMFEWHS